MPTMRPRALLACLVVATLLACKTAEPGPNELAPELEAQLDDCVDSLCLRLACDPLFEPPDDFGQQCRDTCESHVTESAAADCSEELTDLIACTEALTCETYLQWTSEPGTSCTAEEAVLRDGCGVDLRAAE